MHLSTRVLFAVCILVSALFGGVAATLLKPAPVLAAPSSSFGPPIRLTILDAQRVYLNTSTSEWAKMTNADSTNIGSFDVSSQSSLIEVTFQGQLTLRGCNSNALRSQVELRIDDQSSSFGTGRTHLVYSQLDQLVPVTLSGYWANLSEGTHTVSLWARLEPTIICPIHVSSDFAEGGDNDVIIKEYLPYGFTFMPYVNTK